MADFGGVSEQWLAGLCHGFDEGVGVAVVSEFVDEGSEVRAERGVVEVGSGVSLDAGEDVSERAGHGALDSDNLRADVLDDEGHARVADPDFVYMESAELGDLSFADLVVVAQEDSLGPLWLEDGRGEDHARAGLDEWYTEHEVLLSASGGARCVGCSAPGAVGLGLRGVATRGGERWGLRTRAIGRCRRGVRADWGERAWC